MKRTKHLTFVFSWVAAAVIFLCPLGAWAEDVPPAPPALSPIVITEIQAGSGTNASEEFIELYNTGDQPIDLTAQNWQLELASTTAANWASPLRTITLTGTIAPGGYYVVASQFTTGGQTLRYLPTVASDWFSAGVSAAAGHIRLMYSTNQPQSDGACSAVATVVDEVEWSSPKNSAAATPSLDSRTPFVTAKSTGIPAGSSLQRLINPTTHTYVDSDNDASDFIQSGVPSPGIANTQLAPAVPVLAQPAVVMPADLCDPNPPVSSPADNSQDGGTGVIPPDGASGLPSSGSDNPPAQNGETPETQPAIPAADNGLLPPEITEMLPNPATPQTDAADEFIELYNPNDANFVLDGFKLQAGLSTARSYTFPAGTVLLPHAYTAYFSSTTNLSLSNTDGQARLLDPLSAQVASADPYGTAKDGQAWAFNGTSWQWTVTPTPNAVNVFTAPPSSTTSKATAKTAAKSAAAVKADSTTKTTLKTPKVTKPKTTKAGAALTQPVAATAKPSTGSSLTVGILAAVAFLAVLYGAYEYRHDLANKFRYLRENRAARRKGRQRA